MPESPINAPLQFHINHWAAWSAGIETPEQWSTLFNSQQMPVFSEGVDKADVSFIPAMQRRRLSPLARAVFHVAHQCEQQQEQPCPSVFCSVYGESQRTYGLIETIAKQEEVSPMAFSLSVHNAIAGQYSIWSKNTCSSTSLSPSDRSYLSAFAEALGLLQEGAESVLIVCFEEDLPDFYRPYVESVEHPTAVAFSISLATSASDEQCFSLSRHAGASASSLPPLIELIRFFMTQETELQQAQWQLQAQ